MGDNSNSRMQLQLHNNNNNQNPQQQHQHQHQHQINLTSNYNNMQRTPPPPPPSSSSHLNSFDANQQLLGMYGQMGFINTNTNTNYIFNNNNNQQQLGLSRTVTMGGREASLHPHLLSPRHESEIEHGTQFGVKSAGPSLQDMQSMGMINNNLNLNSHMRTNGNLTVSQQRFNLQLRQKILDQASLASIAKLQAQGLHRTPYMNAHLSELAQNGQHAMPQNSVSQRQWSNQMPAMFTTNSPSYRVQQHRQPQTVLQHHLASSPQLPQNSMGLSPQQLAQIAQQQQQQQELLNQQSSPRVIMPTGQKSISLTGSQPDVTGSGGSSSQITEASNLLLGKRKIQDLVSQVDPRGSLDPKVEDLLLELADDFIDSVTTFACSLAKHRKSTTLETKDVLLHLEKNWNLTVPGFSREERKNRQNPVSNEFHKTRLDTIHALREPSQSPINNGKEVARQGIINPGAVNHMMRPSLSSDQLVSHSNASQIMQKMHRF